MPQLQAPKSALVPLSVLCFLRRVVFKPALMLFEVLFRRPVRPPRLIYKPSGNGNFPINELTVGWTGHNRLPSLIGRLGRLPQNYLARVPSGRFSFASGTRSARSSSSKE